MLKQKLFVTMLALSFLLVACGAEEIVPPAGEVPDLVQTAVDRLSEETGVAREQIEVVSFQEMEWPDGCLGLGGPDEMCTQAIVPGWQIIVEANGIRYEIRTDEGARTIRWQTLS